MKPAIIFLLLLLFTHPPLKPQSCLPQGISFTLQSQIDEFQDNHPGCKVIEGDVLISGYNITNLDGLAVLEGFEGSLKIIDCDLLSDISGLSNVVSIGHDFFIQENDLLTELEGLNSLMIVGGFFVIQNNHTLQNLEGLNSLSIVEGNFFVASNPQLQSFAGLESLEEVLGDMIIYNNGSPNSPLVLEGTPSLTHIDGRLSIEYNNLISFGFNKLVEVSGDLNIFYSPLLETINGFESLTSIDGNLNIWHNVNLTDISAFANVAAGSISNLYITENISLSACAIRSVCDYLTNPNGTVVIHTNAPGCNSEEEILEACAWVGVPVNNLSLDLKVFPNPTKDRFTISGLRNEIVTELYIYNLRGELLRKDIDVGLVIDISSLKQGFYIIEIIQGDSVIRNKLIVK